MWKQRFLVLGLTTIIFGGCKPKATTPSDAAASSSSGGGGNTNYIPGAGAVHNVRQAARRTISLNDMNTLGQLVEFEYTSSGRMPSYDAMKASLAKDAPNVLAAINEGAIILCWTTSHEGLWAYEVDADTRGGVACVTGRAGRYDATEIKQMLGR